MVSFDWSAPIAAPVALPNLVPPTKSPRRLSPATSTPCIAITCSKSQAPRKHYLAFIFVLTTQASNIGTVNPRPFTRLKPHAESRIHQVELPLVILKVDRPIKDFRQRRRRCSCEVCSYSPTTSRPSGKSSRKLLGNFLGSLTGISRLYNKWETANSG